MSLKKNLKAVWSRFACPSEGGDLRPVFVGVRGAGGEVAPDGEDRDAEPHQPLEIDHQLRESRRRVNPGRAGGERCQAVVQTVDEALPHRKGVGRPSTTAHW